jgi:hypothetical protein
LQSLAVDDSVVAAFDRAARALWDELDADSVEWSRNRFASTLAGALTSAAQALCPEFDVDNDLIVDVRAEGVTAEIWLSERSPGGGGMIEVLQDRMVTRPRKFLALLDRAIKPSDFEVVDTALRRLLAAVEEDDDGVVGPLAKFRAASTNSERGSRLGEIRRALSAANIANSQPVMAAVSARIIRLGSAAATDAALATAVAAWSDYEQELGIEIDPMAFAFALRRDSALDPLVSVPDPAVLDAQRMHSLASLLWPCGWRARAEALSIYSPYSTFPATDRLALERYRVAESPSVSLEDKDWREAADRLLAAQGVAVLETKNPTTLSEALRAVAVSPTEIGSLLIHPAVIGIERLGDSHRATVVVSDGVVR